MIHEIAPKHMDNQYHEKEVQDDSRICFCTGRKILGRIKDGMLVWPLYHEVKDQAGECTYLFSISGRDYFLAEGKEEREIEDAVWMDWGDIRDKEPTAEAFAGMTAMHLSQWHNSVQYCGCCGAKTVHDKKERMMRCPSCGNMMFPKISPAIIVAVTDDKNRLLVTKYAGRTSDQYALVAGFVEIGETLEECVQRELMEEVGIRVKDIRYYASQPWGCVGNLMVGFTAKLDGSDQIHLDKTELGLAKWLTSEEVPEIDDYSSLTREMIRRFKHGCL